MSKLLPFKHPGTYVRELGSGAYGKVCEIEYQGRLCALKYGSDRSIKDEAKAIQAIGKHPNVVQVLESGFDASDGLVWWMAMEKFDENLVTSFKRGKIKDWHLKTMFRHILEALIYIQSQGYAHCDCHMGNIGVKWDKPTQPRFILCDFGLAICYREEDGQLIDVPNIRNDFDRFFRVVRRYLPYPDSDALELERTIRDWTLKATVQYAPRILTYLLLDLASEQMVKDAIGSAIGGRKIDSLRLILSVKAQQTGTTLASMCRELLESHQKIPTGMDMHCGIEPFMAMFEWAGYVDNPEIRQVVSEENSWVIRLQVKGDLPELLQRLLSM